ncbi:hypothetical protein TruAng_007310 [Truncatella angustata]|nr:hypothetical protein TruAng_007310 [Truncatella angustata]
MPDARRISLDVAKWTAVPANNSLLWSLLEIFNAVLAAAWHGYQAVQSRAEHWRPDNLGYRFYAEAQRLLHREQDKAKITSVQAMGIMSITFTSNALDKLSWSLLHKAIEMAQQLGLFSHSPESDPMWQKAAAITSWGVFNWQSLYCYHMFQPPLLNEPPNHDLPGVLQDTAFFGNIHVKYPGSEHKVDISHGHVFRAMSGFRIIMNAVALELYGSGQNGLSLDRLDHFWQAIKDWYRSLPACLEADKIALPNHLKLHMHMHVLVIGLFEPFEKHVQSLLSRGLPDPGKTIAQSKASLETLIRLYYLRHGFESYDPTMMLFISMLAWSCLQDYKQMKENGSPQLDAVRSTLVLCAKGLWDQGENCFLSEVLFRLLKSSLPSKDEVQLLREVADIDEEPDRVSRMIQEVHSAWPFGIFSTAKTSIEEASLSRYIAWCEQVLEDPSQHIGTQTPDQPESHHLWVGYNN